MKTSVVGTVLLLGLSSGAAFAADYPQAGIANGQVRAKIYLPDAEKGFYRSTRFDWSGVFASLECKGHSYFGPWFDSIDPSVRDFKFDGPNVVAGAVSSTMGPAEEFASGNSALGYDEAKAGGTFIKIGVGVLRKPEEPRYDHFRAYEMVNPGKWTVRKGADFVEFTQVVSGGAGYAYLYRKTARLTRGKPELVLEHSLKNTGKRAFETSVYDHNFLVIDKQATGPDFTLTFPFEIQTSRPPAKEMAEIRGKQIAYVKTLASGDRVSATVQGYGNTAKDYDIRVENTKTGAGVRITGDKPLSNLVVWSIKSVIAPEPFVTMSIEPGQESTWRYNYEFYTLPGK
ncbi:MAG: hypothetical protein NTW28_17635 [Candidatus Solibacter sp.]|nr:hypothetical protein [Candidatus Solibacter sp.]